MKIPRQIVLFCSVFTILAQSALAHQGDRSLTEQTERRKVVGFVKTENDRPVCVKTLDGYAFIQNELPVCSDDQSEIVMGLAQSGAPIRTAWLSHAALVGAGCLMGAVSAMGGMSLESGLSSDNRGTHEGAITGPIVVGGTGAVLMAAAGEPTGHLVAGLTGLVACAGAFNYLLYSERKRAKLW